uniref:Uncharacterized protein n=1 Tax=Arundo donax TaxID=35708 RepID=A0A0A9CJB9_ARUDO
MTQCATSYAAAAAGRPQHRTTTRR